VSPITAFFERYGFVNFGVALALLGLMLLTSNVQTSSTGF